MSPGEPPTHLPAQPAGSAGQRQTQAQRRAATSAKITTAALAILGRVGYPQMTYADVADAAGVSRGALLHYFPQKGDLAIAAVAAGEAQVLGRLRELVAAAAATGDRQAAILDALYEIHAGPEFQGFLALQAHARTDPELNQRLHVIVERATREISRIAAAGWGSSVAGSSELATLIAVALGTVRGLVVISEISQPPGENVWPAARAMILDRIRTLGRTAP